MIFKEFPGDPENKQTASSINPKIEPEDQGDARTDPAPAPHAAEPIRVVPRWLPRQVPSRQDPPAGTRPLQSGRIPLMGASRKGKT